MPLKNKSHNTKLKFKTWINRFKNRKNITIKKSFKQANSRHNWKMSRINSQGWISLSGKKIS